MRPSEGEKPYSDLQLVRELRGMAKKAKSAAKVNMRGTACQRWISCHYTMLG